MTPPTTAWTRLGRRLGTDHNPLRRRSDVIAAWLLPAAVAIFLALSPLVALGAGLWVHASTGPAQRAQQSWHEVQAVMVRAVPGPLVPGNSDSWITWAPARWTDAGQVRTGLIPAPAGSWAGQREPLWLNRAGRPQMPPLTGAQVRYRVVGTTWGALGVLALVLAATGLVCYQVIDRRRVASWETAWSSEGAGHRRE
jgi:hypothetical protein